MYFSSNVGALVHAADATLIIEVPTVESILRANGERTPADLSVAELRLGHLLAVTSTGVVTLAVLVQLLKPRPTMLHHAHDFCDEVGPGVRHICLTLTEESCLLFRFRSIGVTVYEPDHLAEEHLNAEEHRPDGGIVLAHLLEDFGGTNSHEVSQKLLIDSTIRPLEPRLTSGLHVDLGARSVTSPSRLTDRPKLPVGSTLLLRT
jgi:hypothetical protein